MEVDSYRFKIEENKIKKSIYFERSIGIEEKILRQELIRSFIAKKHPGNKVIQYNEFLRDYFSFEYSALVAHFPGFAAKAKTLLMYHFTPLYFLTDVLNHMKKTKSGFIHYFIKKDTLVRELPCEYIKLAFFHWWEETIYQKVPRAEKNSREKYKGLVKIINNFWSKDQNPVLHKIEQNTHAKRAFQIHNLNILRPFLIAELSYSFFLLYTRFLGYDFIYSKFQQKAKTQSTRARPVVNQQQEKKTAALAT